MFIALNVDACFEVGNFGYRVNIDIFERVKYHMVRYRRADIGYDYPLSRINKSAYLYYMLVNCNRLSGF